MSVEEMMANGAKVVDVRTVEEFAGGHVAGSVNIPLHILPAQLDEVKDMGPLILCCASGGRSGQAAAFLAQQGVQCVNGGSWLAVDQLAKAMSN